MSTLYFDSSALVKRYLTETGSGWVAALTDAAAGNTIILAAITQVEVAAAFAARQRAPKGIKQAERDKLFRLLVQHCLAEYTIVPISTIMVDRAMHLTQNHRLRGYDAVQLAVALIVNAQYIAAGLPALTFVAADHDLVSAAHAEGLAADNPNLHP